AAGLGWATRAPAQSRASESTGGTMRRTMIHSFVIAQQRRARRATAPAARAETKSPPRVPAARPVTRPSYHGPGQGLDTPYRFESATPLSEVTMTTPNQSAAAASSWRGKVCLITGVTQGIGRVTAREIAKTGMTTVLIARDAARGAEVVQEIKAASGNS